jgi:putative ABC transport system permease protein
MKAILSFYSDALKIALQSIFAHKLRAFLTLIGIIIGVASVVTVGASISGLNTYVVERISKVLGSNHFMIARMAFSGRMEDEEFERRNRRNKKITWDDYEWVRDHCLTCDEIGLAAGAGTDLRQDGIEFPGAIVFGATANMVDIEDKTIESGRFISNDEVTRSAMVVVLGADIKDKFFSNTDPVGRTLKIRGLPMRIVGVEEKRGAFFGDSIDRHVYIPVTTHDFGLVNVEEINNQIDEFTSSIAMVVIPITLITLVVGGIVVMNIMLVSVTERTFEVGLRKAVGATRRQILLQFLIESALLCALGGIIGLLIAWGITALITALASITMTITIGYILLALTVSSVVGMIAGIYPAFKAARLDPILALTHAT